MRGGRRTDWAEGEGKRGSSLHARGQDLTGAFLEMGAGFILACAGAGARPPP